MFRCKSCLFHSAYSFGIHFDFTLNVSHSFDTSLSSFFASFRLFNFFSLPNCCCCGCCCHSQLVFSSHSLANQKNRSHKQALIGVGICYHLSNRYIAYISTWISKKNQPFSSNFVSNFNNLHWFETDKAERFELRCER